jgi:hypothetical protein
MRIELYTPNGHTRLHIYPLTFSALRTTIEIVLADEHDMNAVAWAERWMVDNGLRWHMVRLDVDATRRACELGATIEDGAFPVNTFVEIAHRILHPDHPNEIYGGRSPFSADEYWTPEP